MCHGLASLSYPSYGLSPPVLSRGGNVKAVSPPCCQVRVARQLVSFGGPALSAGLGRKQGSPAGWKWELGFMLPLSLAEQPACWDVALDLLQAAISSCKIEGNNLGLIIVHGWDAAWCRSGPSCPHAGLKSELKTGPGAAGQPAALQ